MTPSPDDSRAEALERLDLVERELAQLEEGVRAAATRLHGELARARAAIHDLHASALEGPPAAAAVEPPIGGDGPSESEPEPEIDEGARLVALDLVLRDVPRADAERELAEGFPGTDAGHLLDEAAANLGR